jgi:hypothetical protein
MLRAGIKCTLMGIAAFAIATMPLQAAEKPVKQPAKAAAKVGVAGAAAPSNRTIPFRGKLASKTDASITVGSRTFEVGAETRITKEGKAATLADAVVGESLTGSYLEKDGKLLAKSVFLGPKVSAADAVKEDKPKKE